MKDYHSLPLWNQARSLTAAVYQVTDKTSRTDRVQRLAGEIQRACVFVLASIQRLGETWEHCSRVQAEDSASRLGPLLAEAHAQGMIGTYDVNLMIREAQSIRESLGEISGHRR
jgi:hypothetical protein